ncbi:MAG: hypothetical protein IPG58_16605 [Acidobacteria bacterium]|nr:hypothetical protein [Acidobacteriota bacterium]
MCAKNGRRFYKDSHIEVTRCFIFGQAAAVFENCHIHKSKGDGYIAARLRSPQTSDQRALFLDKCLMTSSNIKGHLSRGGRGATKAAQFLSTPRWCRHSPRRWPVHHQNSGRKPAYLPSTAQRSRERVTRRVSPARHANSVILTLKFSRSNTF